MLAQAGEDAECPTFLPFTTQAARQVLHHGQPLLLLFQRHEDQEGNQKGTTTKNSSTYTHLNKVEGGGERVGEEEGKGDREERGWQAGKGGE